MTDSCVGFAGVGKHFAGNWVFRDVTFSCPSGATTAIVGESGSGKTTLLQLVNGVLRPDEGAVEVLGQSVPDSGVEAFRRRIGYAVQGAGLFPHMTVRQNVDLLARLERWPHDAIESRFAELLREMGLDATLADRYPNQLSGGQQQRVGLCRALMLKPGLLLLDEPFSAVDPITRMELYELFVHAQRHEGVSALLVTHDMREAVKLAQHLVIVGSGAILQAGTTATVLAAPRPGYVARLIETQL